MINSSRAADLGIWANRCSATRPTWPILRPREDMSQRIGRRQENQARDDALWNPMKAMGRLFFRKSPVGVTLRSAGRDDIVAKKGERSVILVGLPGEIILHAFGRSLDKCHVVVQGDPADVAAFEAAPRGM